MFDTARVVAREKTLVALTAVPRELVRFLRAARVVAGPPVPVRPDPGSAIRHERHVDWKPRCQAGLEAPVGRFPEAADVLLQVLASTPPDHRKLIAANRRHLTTTRGPWKACGGGEGFEALNRVVEGHAGQ